MKSKILFASVTLIFCFLINTDIFANEPMPRTCGLESCHGINLKCGFNFPQICNQMYALGDFCRDYAKCEISGKSCQLVKNSILDSCLNCIKSCSNKNPLKMNECENKCRAQIEKLRQKTD